MAAPSTSVHGVVKTCVPAHALGVGGAGGGAGVGVLSGGGAGGEDGVALVDDAEGSAGGGVVTWDVTAAVPPPLFLAPPHPTRIAPVSTAARTRMCPLP